MSSFINIIIFGCIIISCSFVRKSKPTASPKEVVTKPPSGPTKAPTSCSFRTGLCRKVGKSAFRSIWNRCSARMGCIPRYRPSRKTKAPTTKAAPKARTTKAPVKAKPNPTKSRCGAIGKYICTLGCHGIGWLLDDILGCKDRWKVTLPEPTNRNEVLAKKVVEMQIVEIPMGQCGYTITVQPYQSYNFSPIVYNVSTRYGEKTIKCLHRLGVKTSISGKTDRVMHSGMLVKTKDGAKYLIHKVKEGKKGSKVRKGTIIEVPNNAMYNKKYEKVGGPIFPRKLRSVEEYFRESGQDYNFMDDNCHDATLRMKDLANKP